MSGGVRGYINESYNHIKIIEVIFTISEVIFTISVRATLRLIGLFWQHLERGFLFTINSGMSGWYRMHSQHSVHSAPGSRMDGMAFCQFRNMNADIKERAHLTFWPEL